MATPLYVVKALAEVRENGSVNMMNRAGVESLVSSDRAQEWLEKASDGEFMNALNDMGAYISDDYEPEETDQDEIEFCQDCGFPWHEHRANGSCPTDDFEF